jgi:hypothetical protein
MCVPRPGFRRYSHEIRGCVALTEAIHRKAQDRASRGTVEVSRSRRFWPRVPARRPRRRRTRSKGTTQ